MRRLCNGEISKYCSKQFNCHEIDDVEPLLPKVPAAVSFLYHNPANLALDSVLSAEHIIPLLT